MGIKFHCLECDKKLHVKSFLAGKRGICPSCGAKIRIPEQSETPAPKPQVVDASKPSKPTTTESRESQRDPDKERAEKQITVATSPAARPTEDVPERQEKQPDKPVDDKRSKPATKAPDLKSPDPIAESPEAVWYVRPSGGGQYGPANGETMQQWIGEGRVAPVALVWREGWADWKTAGHVFPTLTSETSQDAPLLESTEISEKLEISDDQSIASRQKSRKQPRSQKWNIAAVAVLSIVCIALLVALVMVLRNQG